MEAVVTVAFCMHGRGQALVWSPKWSATPFTKGSIEKHRKENWLQTMLEGSGRPGKKPSPCARLLDKSEMGLGRSVISRDQQLHQLRFVQGTGQIRGVDYRRHGN